MLDRDIDPDDDYEEVEEQYESDCDYDYDDYLQAKEPTDYEIEMGNNICDSGRWRE